MKRDQLILIAAVVTGVIAFMMILNYLNVASQPKFTYVIASTDIKKGQKITNDNLTYSQPMLAKKDADYLYVQLQDVVGCTAKEDIRKGDFVWRPNVQKEEIEDPSKQSYAIPEGMGALTVFAKDIIDIPEGLKPGSYVNIMGLVPDYTGQLQHVTLIYSSQIVSMNRTNTGSLISLQIALTPKETETLTGALGRGQLRFVLLAKKGNKQTFLPSFGQIEIIRATSQQKAVTFGSISEQSRNILKSSVSKTDNL